MKPAIALVALVSLAGGAAQAQQVPSKAPSPELEACATTGLLALKEKSPSITDVAIDPDSAVVAKADTKVEDTPVRTVVMGEAYLERNKSEKPYRFVCLIGDKGKVLLTFFTQQ
ncbi:MAG: hypothetical protein JWR08_2513 [Enterovirga sp.]|jgi:hypothetical protein|nr:hypothetical protein [Enterovirga sp.]